VRVVYNFNGLHGPLKITIFNKTNQPLEINWRKSSLVRGELNYSYFSPDMSLVGTMIRSYRSADVGSIEGQIRVNEEKQYLPPGSALSKIPFLLMRNHIQDLSFNDQPREVIEGKQHTRIKLRKLVFSPDNSPVSFRSFLTFKLGADGREFYQDPSFYISEIWKTSNTMSSMPDPVINSGNLIYF
jgi:hypothetical protein